MDISLASPTTETTPTPTVIANADEDGNNNNDDNAALPVTENETLVATNNDDKN